LLQRFELSATDSVFVDDHPPNVQAAERLGMHTVCFRDARQCELELARLLGHC
jgi:putative hydrolase of the HAD superfamily